MRCVFQGFFLCSLVGIFRNRDNYASVGLKDDTSEYLAAHEQPHIPLRSRVLALYRLGLSSVLVLQDYDLQNTTVDKLIL